MQGVGTTKISRSVTDASCLERYLWTTVACNFHTMPRYAKIDQETMGSQRRLWRSSFTSYDWLWLNIYGPRSSCDCHPKPVAGLNSVQFKGLSLHWTEPNKRWQRPETRSTPGSGMLLVSCQLWIITSVPGKIHHDPSVSQGISWYFYMCLSYSILSFVKVFLWFSDSSAHNAPVPWWGICPVPARGCTPKQQFYFYESVHLCLPG